MNLRPFVVALFLLGPVGCDGSSDEGSDASPAQDVLSAADAEVARDAGPRPDARVRDAEAADAPAPDIVALDGADPADAGMGADADTEASDAEAPDAEEPDAASGPCGDGVVDPLTEACDPGLSPCCALDCSGPASDTTICRAGADECDAEELCDGVNLDCGPDDRLDSGEKCAGCPAGEYCAGCYEGACADSRTFCADLLTRGQAVGSGIYEIRPSATASVAPNAAAVSAYCDMETDGGGWTMVFKKSRLDPLRGDFLWGNGAVNGDDQSFMDRDFEVADYTNAFQLDYWTAFSDARIEVLTGTVTQKFINFDVSGSTHLDWFSPTRHTASSWTDLPTSPTWDNNADRAFRIGNIRSFYINRIWGGCPSDRGWMMITTQTTCFWENTANGPPEIIYSRLTTESHIPTAAETGYADSMVIFLR